MTAQSRSHCVQYGKVTFPERQGPPHRPNWPLKEVSSLYLPTRAAERKHRGLFSQTWPKKAQLINLG
eukprot:1160480-Pelagomonas_calceolata.AAC.1